MVGGAAGQSVRTLSGTELLDEDIATLEELSTELELMNELDATELGAIELAMAKLEATELGATELETRLLELRTELDATELEAGTSVRAG